MNCQFCKKEFAYKGTLATHQQTAKYCLELQGKVCSKFECQFCAKKFTTQQNLNDHGSICKEKERNQYVNKLKEHEYKIQELEKQRSEYEEKLKIQKQDCIAKIE